MDIFLAYIFTFFVIFIIMPVTYYLLRFVLWLILDFFGCNKSYHDNQNPQQERRITFGHIYGSNFSSKVCCITDTLMYTCKYCSSKYTEVTYTQCCTCTNQQQAIACANTSGYCGKSSPKLECLLPFD